MQKQKLYISDMNNWLIIGIKLCYKIIPNVYIYLIESLLTDYGKGIIISVN